MRDIFGSETSGSDYSVEKYNIVRSFWTILEIYGRPRTIRVRRILL